MIRIPNCYASHSLALLYLHAPEHQDTISFYQQIMSTVPFKALLDDTQWTLWMADITTPQGYSVQTQLGIATLPSLVLVQCVSARSLRVVFAFCIKVRMCILILFLIYEKPFISLNQ